MTPIVTIGTAGFDAVHIVLLLGVLGLAFAAYVLWGRAALARREQVRTEEDLSETRQALKTQQDLAREAERKLDQTLARSESDEQKFAELAQGVLRNANAQFLQLADETFKRHKEGAQTNLKELVSPINKNLEEFAKRVGEIEKVRGEDKSALKEQIELIQQGLTRHTSETNRLVTALSAPKGGGRWGETTLRNVMEQAGLAKNCDFLEQVHDKVDDKILRPDVIIKLPGGREIVVDSKVTIEDYLKAHDTTDAVQKALHLKAHGAKVKEHIKRLGSKSYQDSFSTRVDFVALFIPGENFYVAALEQEPDLFEFAAARQVIVVTPSTLLALAKAVAYGWRQEQATENARKAAEIGRDLHSALISMGTHIEKLGKSLSSGVDNYNKFVGSLERNVLPKGRKFEELHITQSSDKTLPALEQVDNPVRIPNRSGELDFSIDDETDENPKLTAE
tara:strand:+ start:508 stop:1857 length:1350 start_codon:yes stop_codon:yes gene_type:complete